MKNLTTSEVQSEISFSSHKDSPGKIIQKINKNSALKDYGKVASHEGK